MLVAEVGLRRAKMTLTLEAEEEGVVRRAAWEGLTLSERDSKRQPEQASLELHSASWVAKQAQVEAEEQAVA